MSEAPDPAPPIRKKNNAWIWFFVFIVIASVAVTGIMIWFNRSIQLTPELLERAEERWRNANIKNYNLIYKKKLNDEDWVTFGVKVRNGAVTEVLMNGKPLQRSMPDAEDPLPYHSMDAHFRYLTKFMDIDQQPKTPKVYFVATFDARTGAILRYTRYDSHQKQRIEMHFTLTLME